VAGKTRRWRRLYRSINMSEDLFKGQYRIPSTRLRFYDYASAGMYFVTINAHRNKCLFGQIESQTIVLSQLGRQLVECWSAIPSHFPHVELDVFQVMPNHFHGILLFVRDGEGAGGLATTGSSPGPLKRGSLSTVVNSMKGAVTYYSRQQGLKNTVWQARFHEHVIRNAEELARIRDYIIHNPAQWEADRYYKSEMDL
jgi:putative transposase